LFLLMGVFLERFFCVLSEYDATRPMQCAAAPLGALPTTSLNAWPLHESQAALLLSQRRLIRWSLLLKWFRLNSAGIDARRQFVNVRSRLGSILSRFFRCVL